MYVQNKQANQPAVVTQTTLATLTNESLFIAQPTYGPAPLTVTFTANTKGDADYSIDFGDKSGDKVNLKIVHTYTSPGIYEVNLFKSERSGDCPKGANCMIPPMQRIATTTITVTSGTN